MELEHLVELHRILCERFSTEGLGTLCFRMGISYDDRPGVGLSGKARELIEYCKRRERILELIITGKRLRPDIPWPDVPIPPKLQLPYNLPPRSNFVGRMADKAQIHESLRSHSRLVSIDGMGGVGKTALALEVAYECLRASRDDNQLGGVATFAGFIWATAKGRELTLDVLLNIIVHALDYPGIAQKSIEEKQAQVLNWLRGNPYLLVVDNLDTVTDKSVLDFLRQLPERSRALITTRTQGRLEAGGISLKPLEKDESLDLIRSEGARLELVSVERADREILVDLYLATGGAPLAIKWAVGQIKHRGQSLEGVLEDLYQAELPIIDGSWKLLSADARLVLTVMPLFATSATWAGIEAASGVHSSALKRALGQLVEMSLVDATDELKRARRRYSIHPLTRFFVIAKCRSESAFVQSAFERVLAYYKRLVTLPKEEQTGVLYWDGLVNHAGIENLEEEWDNLAHLIRWALDSDLEAVKPEWRGLAQLIGWPSGLDRNRVALDLFLPLVHLLNAWGLWNERLELSREMCQVAEDLEDPVEAWLWIDAIGFLARERGRIEEFKEALKKGREVALASNSGLADALMLADTFEAGMYVQLDKPNPEIACEKIAPVLENFDLDSVLKCSKVHQIVVARVIDPGAILCVDKEDLEGAKRLREFELKLRRSSGENTTRPLLHLAHICLKQNDVPSAKEFLNQVSNCRPRDLASCNYAKSLVAEREGQLQQALEFAELALKHHKRFEYVEGEGEYQELLKRLHQQIAGTTNSEEQQE